MNKIWQLALRLYPRAWRERYGEEFLAMLEQCHLSWQDHFDVLFGALGERFYVFFIGERFSMQESSKGYPLLRGGMLAGILLTLGLVIYGLILIHATIDSLAAACLITILLALYGYTVFIMPQNRVQAGLPSGLVCGVIFGVIFAAYLAITNLSVLDRTVGDVMLKGMLTSMCVLWLAAGIFGAWKTGTLTAGICAGIWSGMIGALITVIALLFITYAFMDIINQLALTYPPYLHSSVKDVTVFNIEDTLGGCFFTLLFAPIFAAVLGAVGAFISKGHTHLFRTA